MASTETLIAPQAAAETIDNQSSTEAMAEVGYTYERLDGTIERALNSEDAIARCPVLGKLAIEAPEQADVLLELAAAGREKMEADAKAKLDIGQKSTETAKIDEQISGLKRDSLTTPERTKVEQPQYKEPVAVQHAEVARRQAQQEEALYINKDVAERSLRDVTTVPVADKVQIDQGNKQPKIDDIQTGIVTLPKVSRSETAAQAPPNYTDIYQRQQVEAELSNSLAAEPQIADDTAQISQTIEDTFTQDVIHQMDTPMDDEYNLLEATPESIEITEATTDAFDAEAALGGAEVGFTNTAVEIGEPNKLFQMSVSDYEVGITDMREAKTDLNEQLEPLFGPETIETHKQLTDLITAAEMSQLAASEPLEIADIVAVEPKSKTDIKIATTVDFETFVSAQPASEEQITLEVIQEHADEQPLEQTFMQLVELLSEATEATEQNELSKILQELKVAIPVCYIVQETEEIKPQITPEMTEKLLMLLRALGYQSPSEALVRFVGSYNLAFLLQALEYLCQLNDINNRQEFAAASVAITATNTDDDTDRLRLGRVLFGLISKATIEPSI